MAVPRIPAPQAGVLPLAQQDEETPGIAIAIHQEMLRLDLDRATGDQIDRIHAYSMNRLAELRAESNAQNAVESSGVLVTPTDNLQVRVTGALITTKDLENLPLRANGNSFRLGDFATVTRGYIDPPRDKMRYNGKEVIGLGVAMEKGGDIIVLGRLLEEKAAAIQANGGSSVPAPSPAAPGADAGARR